MKVISGKQMGRVLEQRGWTLARIGEHLGRTPEAVAGLLKRGLKRLRELLGESA